MPSAMRVLIRGSYGAGNFGDDILSVVAHRSVTSFVPPAHTFVEAQSSDYITRLLGPAAQIIARSDVSAEDVVVLGGGGPFYDFMGGPMGLRLVERLLPLVGAHSMRILHALASRSRGRRHRQWGAANIAYGIGIGPYAPGSINKFIAAGILSRFQGIAVRDPASLALCKSWHLARRTRQFTDIAFLHRMWQPAELPSPAEGRNRIGVVVRDWKHAPHRNTYLQPLAAALGALQRRGWSVTLISFDAKLDRSIVNSLPLSADYLDWRPSEQTLAQFCRALASHELLITARAHGAIIGSCLGLPSVCVGIEPKLAAASQMVPNCTSLWHPPFDSETLLGLVEALRSPAIAGLVGSDVARNTELAEGALAWLAGHLRSVADRWYAKLSARPASRRP